jgi:PKD repeat protein
VGATAGNVPPTASFTSNCEQLNCLFSSAGSGDPDGANVAYSWSFGDGATSAARSPQHDYAAEGVYPVTLTVTDDGGASTATTRSVTVNVPNQPPIPSFTVTCTALSCQVDASASNDPDGFVTAYSWDFGDGSPSQSGTSLTHAYAAEGTYTIALTVTDDDGAPATTSRSVSVATVPASITFVGESDKNANGTSWSVQVPSGVAAGDGLVLSASANSASVTVSAPSGSGWQLLTSKTAGSLITKVWQKVAEPSDAGSTVTFTSSGTIKLNVVLLAYRGTSSSAPVSAFAVASETVSRTTHTTPTVGATTDGSRVVSLWADKSSATTDITPPAGQSQRYEGCTDGSGRLCTLITDSGPATSGSVVGGLTATANAASASDTMWTLVLQPAG